MPVWDLQLCKGTHVTNSSMSTYQTFSYHQSDDIIQCETNLQFNPLLSGNPKRGTLANSGDPDQMLHNAASDQGLHCLLTAIFVENQINLIKLHITPLI